MGRIPLSRVTLEVANFIVRNLKRSGRYPTIREIASAFGWNSPAAPVVHIQRLAAMGILEYQPTSGAKQNYQLGENAMMTIWGPMYAGA